MTTWTYNSHGGDSTMSERDGQPVTILEAIRHADLFHDQEVLPMYVAVFPDGHKIEVWCDELLPHRHATP